MKRYKSTTILGGGPPGKIVQCQSFDLFFSNDFSRSYEIQIVVMSLATKLDTIVGTATAYVVH